MTQQHPNNEDTPEIKEHGYWRSLRALDPSFVHDEFLPGATEIEIPPVDRRSFLGAMGASLALAGVSLSGCVRKPKEKILPFSSRPENTIPGKPKYYATSTLIGSSVLGLVIESQDGRPTKVEGNPKHPMSLGGTNAWAQSSVLDLYDPDRSKHVVKSGQVIEGGAGWAAFDSFAKEHFAGFKTKQGLALLTAWRPSPSYQRLLQQFLQTFPQAKVYLHDAVYPANSRAGLELAGVKGHQVNYRLDRAKVIVSLDCDFMGVDGDVVRNARHFADGRRLRGEHDDMNRLYCVDPMLSVTSGMADHRLSLPASQVGGFAAQLCAAIFQQGVPVPDGAAELLGKLKAASQSSSDTAKWLTAVSKDLAANKGNVVVVVGERQPAHVHAIAMLINVALDALGKTVEVLPSQEAPASSVSEFVEAAKAGQIQTAIVLGANPVYDAPGDLSFAAAFEKIQTRIHVGTELNETGKAATWHLPESHYLEAWGDWRANDGTTSVQQPLIAPLYGTRSGLEVLGAIVGQSPTGGHDLVRTTGQTTLSPSEDSAAWEKLWRRLLHDGVATAITQEGGNTVAWQWQNLSAKWPSDSNSGNFEANWALDLKVLDGRYANNSWLQELPHSISKLTWDNAALIGPGTANKLGVKDGDWVELSDDGGKLEIAVFTVPGTAEGCFVLPLGYGRTAVGAVGLSVGFNVNGLRSTANGQILRGVQATKLSKPKYKFATTQEFGSLVEPFTGRKRPLIREATLSEYRKEPNFVTQGELLPAEELKSLFKTTNVQTGQQWGMSIDLGSCNGCSACMVACQSENNIPVVGKERVADGREMHWIRVDRYFNGDAEDPQMVAQPVPCMQCETAPCETVCPVTATAHTPDGLNDMVYNRCIGTRYCSNNCPYKVRRFNYFNFQKENDIRNPLLAMQRNPDVTVRFRGVMEKCTYCVQRIQEAKIVAKRDGDGTVPDGAITPACAQSCPTQAITFGDINDPKSSIATQKRNNRNYALLAELHTKPRTTYLGRVRNPNPEL